MILPQFPIYDIEATEEGAVVKNIRTGRTLKPRPPFSGFQYQLYAANGQRRCVSSGQLCLMVKYGLSLEEIREKQIKVSRSGGVPACSKAQQRRRDILKNYANAEVTINEMQKTLDLVKQIQRGELREFYMEAERLTPLAVHYCADTKGCGRIRAKNAVPEAIEKLRDKLTHLKVMGLQPMYLMLRNAILETAYANSRCVSLSPVHLNTIQQ